MLSLTFWIVLGVIVLFVIVVVIRSLVLEFVGEFYIVECRVG